MTFPRFSRILGPETLARPVTVRVDGAELIAYRRIQTPEDYCAWHDDAIELGGGLAWDSPEPVRAEVREGRWTAHCRWCAEHGRNTLMLTRPDWRLACCAECGARYEGDMVVFPDTEDEITEALLLRPLRENQNWLLGEAVADLIAENAEHGVGE